MIHEKDGHYFCVMCMKWFDESERKEVKFGWTDYQGLAQDEYSKCLTCYEEEYK